MTRGLLLPVGIVAYVAVSYLRGVPTAGDDLFLVAGCAAALGTVLGGLSGTFTAVYEDSDGVPLAKDGVIAAALWVLGHLDSGASRRPRPTSRVRGHAQEAGGSSRSATPPPCGTEPPWKRSTPPLPTGR